MSIIIDSLKNKRDKEGLRKIHLYYPEISRSIRLNQFYLDADNLLCIKSNDQSPHDRVCVPLALIHTALQFLHKSVHLTHPGINQTRKLIEEKYYWEGYFTDARKFVLTCAECQLAKGSRNHRVGLLHPLPQPPRPL